MVFFHLEVSLTSLYPSCKFTKETMMLEFKFLQSVMHLSSDNVDKTIAVLDDCIDSAKDLNNDLPPTGLENHMITQQQLFRITAERRGLGNGQSIGNSLLV